jgi:hypothetical protein
VTLLLTKSQVRPKNGVQYFGIVVSDLAGAKKNLWDGGVALTAKANGQNQFHDPPGEPRSRFGTGVELT